MKFRVRARTVVQLGAELISSDAIAFYELIKNAFDAGSPRVTIDVFADLPHAAVSELRACTLTASPRDVPGLRARLLELIEEHKPSRKEVKQRASAAKSRVDLLDAIDRANVIVIEDRGHGMSLSHLEGVFLEIGTPFRLQQRRADDRAKLLGEKGLGRLSSMRLGWLLSVRTSRKGDATWHVLDIDWEDFVRDPEAYIEEVEIPKPREEPKADPSAHGTIITIRHLLHEWTTASLVDIATDEFSRLTDPFTAAARYPITLRFNGETVPVPSFSSTVFSWGHAVVEASFETRPHLRFAGRIDYRLHHVDETFELGPSELAGITGTTPEELRSLGPFTVKFYWYNRKLLTAVEGFGTRSEVLELVRDWANGLMLFRDGFRVNPYGGPEDDWLDLDERAFGSKGYKVNRHQIIGKVDISAARNPGLIDQTNREGLRATPEYRWLVQLLQHLMWQHFKTLLERVERSLVPPLSLGEIEARVDEHRRVVRTAVARLTAKFPAIKRDPEVLEEIDSALRQIGALMKQAQKLADQYENRRNELVHLAGIGLMVEVLAHELGRATQHSMKVLADLDAHGLPRAAAPTIATLRAQLKTLNTRLRVLDPLATAARQRKERFDLTALVREVLDAHAGEFERHRVVATLSGPGGEAPPAFPVVMVKGMVVQILENLITNSVYWLKQARRIDANAAARIEVTVDKNARSVSIADTGPGIAPSLSERIFEPFFTTKPPGVGQGLGLYISRDLAQYHGADLQLSVAQRNAQGRFNTFVLSLPST